MTHRILIETVFPDDFGGEIDDVITKLQLWKSSGVVEIIVNENYEDVTFCLQRLETEEEYQARFRSELDSLRKKQQEEQEWEALKVSQPEIFAKITEMLRKGYR